MKEKNIENEFLDIELLYQLEKRIQLHRNSNVSMNLDKGHPETSEKIPETFVETNAPLLSSQFESSASSEELKAEVFDSNRLISLSNSQMLSFSSSDEILNSEIFETAKNFENIEFSKDFAKSEASKDSERFQISKPFPRFEVSKGLLSLPSSQFVSSTVDLDKTRSTWSIQQSLVSVLEDDDLEEDAEIDEKDMEMDEMEEFEHQVVAISRKNSIAFIEGLEDDEEVEESVENSKSGDPWQSELLTLERLDSIPDLGDDKASEIFDGDVFLDKILGALNTSMNDAESSDHLNYAQCIEYNLKFEERVKSLLEEENSLMKKIQEVADSDLEPDEKYIRCRRIQRRLYSILNDLRTTRNRLCCYSLFISAVSGIIHQLPHPSNKSLSIHEPEEEEIQKINAMLDMEIQETKFHHGAPRAIVRSLSGQRYYKCLKKKPFFRNSPRELLVDVLRSSMKHFRKLSEDSRILKTEIAFSLIKDVKYVESESVKKSRKSDIQVVITYTNADRLVSKSYFFSDLETAKSFVKELRHACGLADSVYQSSFSTKQLLNELLPIRRNTIPTSVDALTAKLKALSSRIAEFLLPQWHDDSTKEIAMLTAFASQEQKVSFASFENAIVHEYCSQLIFFLLENKVSITPKASFRSFSYNGLDKNDLRVLLKISEAIYKFWCSRLPAHAERPPVFENLLSEEKDLYVQDAHDFIAAIEKCSETIEERS